MASPSSLARASTLSSVSVADSVSTLITLHYGVGGKGLPDILDRLAIFGGLPGSQQRLGRGNRPLVV
jgi:hypothetical protein